MPNSKKQAGVRAYPARLRRWLVCLAALLFSLTVPAFAEPVTANSAEKASGSIRVPSPPSGFIRHDGGFIRYAYPPDARAQLSGLFDAAPGIRDDLSDKLGALVLQNVEVRIARTAVEMSTLAPENAPYPSYAIGVTYPELGLILLTLEPAQPNPNYDVLETFKHELAHLALHDAVKGRPIPRWFNEGFAVFVSGESSLPRLQTLWTATVAGNLLPLERLESGFPNDALAASLAYAQAVDVVRYLVRRQDRYRFDALVEQLAQGQDFDRALTISYGIDRSRLESEWREDVGKRYTVWPIVTSSALLWMGIVILFFLGYRRRKQRSRVTLERWRREEATEDAQRAARRALFEQALREAAESSEKRVHIVVSSPELRVQSKGAVSAVESEHEIPKIEHNGNVHTLH